MRTGVALYRHAFEHEIHANHAMLRMLSSVPDQNRGDERFTRAVKIAAHMAACRADFLRVFQGDGLSLAAPFEDGVTFESLESRFNAMEVAWQDYLGEIDDTKVDGFFAFSDNGEKWKLSMEAQLFQLVGHAAYHRGQVVLLADSLGATTEDTDYIEWFTANHPEGWGAVE